MAVEALLPSEIARLVYGYLVDEKCTETAKTFLNESPNLYECRNVLQYGRTFTTRVCGLGLSDILEKFCNVNSLIQDQLIAYDSTHKLRYCKDISTQIKYLLEECSSRHAASNGNEFIQSDHAAVSGTPSKSYKKRYSGKNENGSNVTMQHSDDGYQTETPPDSLLNAPSVEATPLEQLPGYVDNFQNKKCGTSQSTTFKNKVQSQKVQTSFRITEGNELLVSKPTIKSIERVQIKNYKTSDENWSRLNSDMLLTHVEDKQSNLIGPKIGTSETDLCNNLANCGGNQDVINLNDSADQSSLESPTTSVKVSEVCIEILEDVQSELLSRTEIHEKIASNINKLMEPIKNTSQSSMIQENESRGNDFFTNDMDRIIGAAVDMTENDPMFIDMLNTVIQLDEHVSSSKEDEMDIDNENPSSEGKISMENVLMSEENDHSNPEVYDEAHLAKQSTSIASSNIQNNAETHEKCIVNSMEPSLFTKNFQTPVDFPDHNTSTPLKLFTATQNYDTNEWLSMETLPSTNIVRLNESAAVNSNFAYSHATNENIVNPVDGFISPIICKENVKITEKTSLNCSPATAKVDDNLHTPDVPPLTKSFIPSVHKTCVPPKSRDEKTVSSGNPTVQEPSSCFTSISSLVKNTEFNRYFSIDSITVTQMDNTVQTPAKETGIVSDSVDFSSTGLSPFLKLHNKTNPENTEPQNNENSTTIRTVDDKIEETKATPNVEINEIHSLVRELVAKVAANEAKETAEVVLTDNVDKEVKEDSTIKNVPIVNQTKHVTGSGNKESLKSFISKTFLSYIDANKDNSASDHDTETLAKNTPTALHEERTKSHGKSLSTPKKSSSHIRALTFETPLHSQSDSKIKDQTRCASPETAKRNLKRVHESFQSPPLVELDNQAQDTEKAPSTTTDVVNKKRKLETDKITSAANKVSQEKLVDKASVKKSWDSDLRKLLGPVSEQSKVEEPKRKYKMNSKKESSKKKKRDKSKTFEKEKKAYKSPRKKSKKSEKERTLKKLQKRDKSSEHNDHKKNDSKDTKAKTENKLSTKDCRDLGAQIESNLMLNNVAIDGNDIKKKVVDESVAKEGTVTKPNVQTTTETKKPAKKDPLEYLLSDSVNDDEIFNDMMEIESNAGVTYHEKPAGVNKHIDSDIAEKMQRDEQAIAAVLEEANQAINEKYKSTDEEKPQDFFPETSTITDGDESVEESEHREKHSSSKDNTDQNSAGEQLEGISNVQSSKINNESLRKNDTLDQPKQTADETADISSKDKAAYETNGKRLRLVTNTGELTTGKVIYDHVSKLEGGKVVKKKYARLKTLDTKLKLNKPSPLRRYDFILDSWSMKEDFLLEMPRTPQIADPSSNSWQPNPFIKEDSRTIHCSITTPLECPPTPKIYITPTKIEEKTVEAAPKKAESVPFYHLTPITFETTKKSTEVMEFEVIKETLKNATPVTPSEIEGDGKTTKASDPAASSHLDSQDSNSSSSSSSCCSSRSSSNEQDGCSNHPPERAVVKDDPKEVESKTKNQQELFEQNEEVAIGNEILFIEHEEIVVAQEASPAKVFSIDKTDKELLETMKETPAKIENAIPEEGIFETPNISKPLDNPTNLHAKISQMMILREQEELKRLESEEKQTVVINTERGSPKKILTKDSAPRVKPLQATVSQNQQIKKDIVAKDNAEVAKAIESIVNENFDKNQDDLNASNASNASTVAPEMPISKIKELELTKAIHSIINDNEDEASSESSSDDNRSTDSESTLKLVLEDDINLEESLGLGNNEVQNTEYHVVYDEKNYKKRRRKQYFPDDEMTFLPQDEDGNLIAKITPTCVDILFNLKPPNKKPVSRKKLKEGIKEEKEEEFDDGDSSEDFVPVKDSRGGLKRKRSGDEPATRKRKKNVFIF